VPFYLRTGKRLPRRVTEIAVVFRKAPHLPFDATDTEILGSNQLVVRVQPDEGVTLRFGSKVPAPRWRSATSRWTSSTARRSPSPPRGLRAAAARRPARRPLAVPARRRGRGVVAGDRPDREHWREQDEAGVEPHLYRAGEWGPTAADEMLALDGRTWRRP
jgi:glucose-6-phosphate 1-dehydrogenase